MADRQHDDPDAPATPEELAAAARLRDAGDPLVDALRAAWAPDALDAGAHAALLDETAALDAEELTLAGTLREELAADAVVLALRAAWTPADLPTAEHEAIVARALGTRTNVIAFPRARRVLLGATSALAFAAGVVVWLGNVQREAPLFSLASSEQPLARERSTQALFEEPFREGETSARIDRIASARATDFRDNRFTRWGAR